MVAALKPLEEVLTPAKLAELDELLARGDSALDFIAEQTGREHWDCWDALVLYRHRRAARNEPPQTRDAWLETARLKLAQLDRAPVAVEAIWDGDTTGWFLIVSAILPGASEWHPRFREVMLVSMRGAGGDFRLFAGTVPPWPECAVAREIGRLAAARWQVPLHFPSPEKPELDQPRWWDSR